MQKQVFVSISMAIVVVLLLNALLNLPFLSASFNELLGIFYADVTTAWISIDGMKFLQILVVLLLEISVIWSIFYFVSKRIFR